jgi:hypothetical protein
MEDDSWKSEHAPREEQSETVDKQRKRAHAGPRGAVDLVVAKAEVAKPTVVANDILAKLDDLGLVLLVQIAVKE